MSNLPEVDSVWGVVDRPETWVYVYGNDDGRYISHTTFEAAETRATTGDTPVSNWNRWVKESGAVDITAIVSGGSADDVWDEVVEAMQAAWPNETLHWNESPRELITRLINERDDKAKYEAELARCAAIVQKVYLGGVSGIGLLNVADALQEIFADKTTDLSQPFTVEWLCEIGDRKVSDGHQIAVEFGGCFRYWTGDNYWSLRGLFLPKTAKITTRGDVLAWLKVLGIEVKRP